VGSVGFLGIVYLCFVGSGSGYPFSSFPSDSCSNLFLGGVWFLSLSYLPIVPLGAVTVPVLCVI
jgi:hypothetical protein